MGVAPQGHGRVLVAQHIGNYVYGDVRPYRKRCCSVPQFVKADPGETGPFEVLEAVPMNASLAVHLPAAVGKDEGVVFPPAAIHSFSMNLLVLGGAELIGLVVARVA